jgi:hypothetical protein
MSNQNIECGSQNAKNEANSIPNTMAKKTMVQLPRPSTKPGKPGGPAGVNPPKPKK